MKVKGQILICTAIMLNDHSNPYIEITTVLSDNGFFTDTDIGSKYTDISVTNTEHNFTRLEALVSSAMHVGRLTTTPIARI